VQFSLANRWILYVTSQASAELSFIFCPVVSALMSVAHGDSSKLQQCVEDLSTGGFPFQAEPGIDREIWKKIKVDFLFNFIFPLLEAGNKVFDRDDGAANLARELVGECAALMDRLALEFSECGLME